MDNIKRQLKSGKILIAPGVYDALSACIAEKSGFNNLYLSGASISYTKLGRPDIGLLNIEEIADTLRHIKERTNVNIFVDCDTGFGNALNVARSVKILESSGANAIQLEDQTFPKRCGHLKGKEVISTQEMIGKIKSATDARSDTNTLIIGRTDALGVLGIDEAIERANRYHEAGADILFIEGIRNDNEIERIMCEFKGKVPVLANMVEGGDTPIKTANELNDLGFSIVIFPGALVRAYTAMATNFFSALKKSGSTNSFKENMLDFRTLNEYLETDKILKHYEQYEK